MVQTIYANTSVVEKIAFDLTTLLVSPGIFQSSKQHWRLYWRRTLMLFLVESSADNFLML